MPEIFEFPEPFCLSAGAQVFRSKPNPARKKTNHILVLSHPSDIMLLRSKGYRPISDNNKDKKSISQIVKYIEDRFEGRHHFQKAAFCKKMVNVFIGPCDNVGKLGQLVEQVAMAVSEKQSFGELRKYADEYIRQKDSEGASESNQGCDSKATGESGINSQPTE